MSSKAFPVNTKASECKICQNIFVYDIDKSVERALDSLSRGAESLASALPTNY
jgi:methylmalonyl-CoA mutase